MPGRCRWRRRLWCRSLCCRRHRVWNLLPLSVLCGLRVKTKSPSERAMVSAMLLPSWRRHLWRHRLCGVLGCVLVLFHLSDFPLGFPYNLGRFVRFLGPISLINWANLLLLIYRVAHLLNSQKINSDSLVLTSVILVMITNQNLELSIKKLEKAGGFLKKAYILERKK
jgi:hypothetical protein